LANCDVLIVGAGPTGLALALWLTRLGARARIIDKTAASGTTSRALAVQARTLELYRQIDLAEAVLARAHKTPAVNLWAKGARKARISFEDAGAGLTPFPNLHIFPQDEHEALLAARLNAMGSTVERNTELVSFADEGERVTARLRTPLGEESCEAVYIAGCDGAASLVREVIGAGFPGGTYEHIFYVADVEVSGPSVDGELHIDIEEADFLGMFPLKEHGRVRLVGAVRGEATARKEGLRFEDVGDRAIQNLRLSVGAVHWFLTYRVHHRVANAFRKGRAFLLGDAAHIHSPAGGQGMNTGIGDAINLAWKLESVLDRRAPEALLDSYEIERIAFARRLVATTDRVFRMATATGRFAEFVRVAIVPNLLAPVFKMRGPREFAFRTVSQLRLNYRGGPLSEGVAGGVHGGDRLPWVAGGDEDNYGSLRDPIWQAHVYGDAKGELSGRPLPVRFFDWTPKHGAAGIPQNSLYLMRPDSYVALAAAASDGERRIGDYFAKRAVSLPADAGLSATKL